jgi:hypothetical protein
MQQWQAYVKNKSSTLSSSIASAAADAIATIADTSASSPAYSHYLGVFFGMEAATMVPNVSFSDCRTFLSLFWWKPLWLEI